jgi:DNA (cytosine-5)-methyltransferase 1
MYRLLDLFSGIGGFSLGLERSGGFQTVAFCEIDPYCRKVLAKHWPEVPQYDDVRTLTAERLAADGIGVDAICGGFPCQDISVAGKGAGIEGERSGLWSEYARIIGELRPRYVIVENVSALLGRGLDRVLGDLASLGYDAEWHCIPASAVGAPHRRDRLWLVAYSTDNRTGWREQQQSGRQKARYVAHSNCGGMERPRTQLETAGFGGSGQDVADTIGRGQQGSWTSGDAVHPAPRLNRQAVDAFHGRVGHIWSVEPDVGRVAARVPSRVDRLRALGNAVVPQVPELIGRAILAAEKNHAPS